MRSWILFLMAALVPLTWFLMVQGIVEASENRVTATLGYSGPTADFVVITDPERTSGQTATPGEFSHTLRQFAEQNHISIAYSASNDAQILTILDPEQRFHVKEHQANPDDAGSKQGQTFNKILVSQRTPELIDWVGSLMPPDKRLSSEFFNPKTAFYYNYPAVVMYYSDVSEFGMGRYIFTHMSAEQQKTVENIFQLNQYEIVSIQNSGESTVQGVIEEALHKPLSWVLLTFTLATSAATLLIVFLSLAERREQLLIYARLGASRRVLRRRVLRVVLPWIILGCSVGLSGTLVTLVLLHPLLLSSWGQSFGAMGVALLLSIAVFFFALALTVAHEMRKSRHDVIC